MIPASVTVAHLTRSLMTANVVYAASAVQAAGSTMMEDLTVWLVTRDTLQLLICHTFVPSFKTRRVQFHLDIFCSMACFTPLMTTWNSSTST